MTAKFRELGWWAFREQDLVDLAVHHFFLKLKIDGVTSKPFSAETMAPDTRQNSGQVLERLKRLGKPNSQQLSVVDSPQFPSADQPPHRLF